MTHIAATTTTTPTTMMIVCLIHTQRVHFFCSWMNDCNYYQLLRAKQIHKRTIVWRAANEMAMLIKNNKPRKCGAQDIILDVKYQIHISGLRYFSYSVWRWNAYSLGALVSFTHSLFSLSFNVNHSSLCKRICFQRRSWPHAFFWTSGCND